MKSHKTKNDLKSNAKAVSIDILNSRLAEAIDLALATKQAHWNIKGIQFIAVHEMLDSFRAEVDTHIDTMAERVVQLGSSELTKNTRRDETCWRQSFSGCIGRTT